MKRKTKSQLRKELKECRDYLGEQNWFYRRLEAKILNEIKGLKKNKNKCKINLH